MSGVAIEERIIFPIKGKKHVLILGGGLAGLRVALKLEKKMRSIAEWKIVLLDENEYHQYLYRIHEVAGGRASPSEVIVPFEYLLRGKKVEFVQAQVQDIDTESRMVHTDLGRVAYDILVVALGGHAEFYGIEGLRENSFTLQSVKDAVRLRREVENLFTCSRMGVEGAIVIGGGGAVGIELVAELFEFVQTLRKKHNVKETIEVVLVEALERLVPVFESEISEEIAEKLRSMGIRVILNDPVVKAEKDHLELKSGTSIKFSILIWTGGAVRNPSCGTLLKVKNRRLSMDAYCQAEGWSGIYVVGDCALITDPVNGEALPPSAHLATEQADVVVKNILSDITGSPKVEYTPTQIGEVFSIGSKDTVGVVYGRRVHGFLGRMLRRLIHLLYVQGIGGFRLILRQKKVGRLMSEKLLENWHLEETG